MKCAPETYHFLVAFVRFVLLLLFVCLFHVLLASIYSHFRFGIRFLVSSKVLKYSQIPSSCWTTLSNHGTKTFQEFYNLKFWNSKYFVDKVENKIYLLPIVLTNLSIQQKSTRVCDANPVQQWKSNQAHYSVLFLF